MGEEPIASWSWMDRSYARCSLSCISGPIRLAAETDAPGDVEPHSSTSPGQQHTSRARRISGARVLAEVSSAAGS